MAAAQDWSYPFLEQAREDLRAAYQVSPRECPSTICMLLQMVYEKLAKAILARQGTLSRSHQTATQLFLTLQRHPTGVQLLQTSPNVQAFVVQLENAHPSVAGKQTPSGEQLEYPWEDISGVVRFPARDLSLARRVQNPQDRVLLDCLQFASKLAKEIPTLIP